MTEILIEDGHYYIRTGKLLKPVSMEEAIDYLFKDIDAIMRNHDEGD